jgi:nitronate monooxygenase
VGTIFEFADESGLREDLKQGLLDQIANSTAQVFTDPLASPTGFPFKVAQLEGTLSEQEVYENRTRVCDLGYLREAYLTEGGKIGYRCAAESTNAFLAKGGTIEETVGRKCLCNALLADVGHQQLRPDGQEELALVTAGDGINDVYRFIEPGRARYSAADVIDTLLGNRQGLADAQMVKQHEPEPA